MWRKIRILILLVILGIAAWSNWYDEFSTTDWDETLTVGIYPIETSEPVTRDYLSKLDAREVADIETFLNEEASNYGITIDRPVSVSLLPVVAESPPERASDSGVFGNIWWSLKMRLYARRAALSTGEEMPQIRIFVRYHDPASNPRLPHSVGLQKGLVGVAHVFAARLMRGSNSVVIAHEILHTLGATDKYDPVSMAPVYPLGYAEPDRTPRLPQDFAEIMAGRIPIRPDRSEMPRSLDEVVVGRGTAIEIGWVRP